MSKRHTPCSAESTAEVKDPLSPILLHPEKDTETLSVIMPMRV